MPTPYNPASDGFTAKAWECLRRNKEFRKDLHLDDADSEDDAVDLLHIFQTRMATHPFFAAIRDPLIDLSEAWDDSGDPEPAYYYLRSLSIHMSWPEIHPITQGGLEDGLGRYGAFPIEIPDRSAIDPDDKKYSPDKAEKLLADLASNLDTHRAIYVPATVWDRRHKEDILREVAELLGVPLAKDARWLKNRGRALGTEAEWRAFLLVEQWRSRECGKLGPTIAANLAAWEIYAGESFGNTCTERKEAAENFRQECHKLHQHTATIERRVRRVEQAIKSVYPIFDPLLGT